MKRSQIDPKFPLAVNGVYETTAYADLSSVDNLETCSGGYSSIPSFDPVETTDAKSTNFCSKKRTSRRPWTIKDADMECISRSMEHVWKKTILPILESFVDMEPLRDPRIAYWIEELTQTHENLMLLQGSPQKQISESCSSLNRVCENSEWVPLRESWIFTLWKSESIKALLEAQNFRCSGCGIRVEKEYLKRVNIFYICFFFMQISRYCDYYGKVFCQCCHQGSKSTIPARILHTWNFNEFPVCDLASHFLTEVHDVPAIHINHVAPHIIEKVRVLKNVIMLREKLSYMWDFIKNCPDAEHTVTKYGNLRTLFTSLEHHILHSLDLFSLSDLIRVHNKDMGSLLEPIVYYARCHIETCKHCRQFAATCAYCEDAQEVLFPFQLEKVYKCSKCASLSHLKCQAKFRRKVSNQTGCKKCLRVHKDK
ncbi:hypothetical protein DICVIV_02055 [Dictyocaulus viviparus]|uniref:Rubicon Homology domain-containing protein n=1 Tax=Dictyocaulus viviparus TaxID=29172 RepID=A0A0D8Y713_DICVI|nr:hypothetical protein DICVIV_02055 [Dictyocaulus viviparus]